MELRAWALGFEAPNFAFFASLWVTALFSQAFLCDKGHDYKAALDLFSIQIPKTEFLFLINTAFL